MLKRLQICGKEVKNTMNFSGIIDMHTHSDHSFDGNHSCMLLCESAVAKGLNGIAITDHCEIDSKELDFRAFATNQYFESYKAKKFFEGRLLVLQGLELGQAIYKKELAESILNKFKYDFILASIHNLENMEDFYYLDYSQFDVPDLLNKYFDTVYELCLWNRFDSLAHFTYPLRYIKGEAGIDIDLSLFYDKIEAILKTLIKNERALEINTSGLFQKINETLPDKAIIRLFKELGGKYITIGSDSHYYNDLGRGIEQGIALAKECGFDNIAVYQQREPLLIPIE